MSRLLIFTKICGQQQFCSGLPWQQSVRNISLASTLHKSNFVEAGTKKQNGPQSSSTTGKTKEIVTKISLIGPNQTMSVTSLVEAQKLAKRRDLHLIYVPDPKNQRPTYKLVKSSELLESELHDLNSNSTNTNIPDKSASKKSEKSLTIGSRISENDLSARLKNIGKWLVKQHEVRILIQGIADNKTGAEEIVKGIEKYIREPQLIGKIVQKRVTGSVIKFNITPTADTVDSAAKKSSISA